MYVACGGQKLMSGDFFIYLTCFLFVCLRQGQYRTVSSQGWLASLVSQGGISYASSWITDAHCCAPCFRGCCSVRGLTLRWPALQLWSRFLPLPCLPVQVSLSPSPLPLSSFFPQPPHQSYFMVLNAGISSVSHYVLPAKPLI